MKSFKAVAAKSRKEFVMLSFAFLFIILFFSMLLNYITAGADKIHTAVLVIKAVFAGLVVLTVIFYRLVRLAADESRNGIFFVLLNFFAAIDLLFVFNDNGAAGNNVNVFDLATTLYVVMGVSALVLTAALPFKKGAKEKLAAFSGEIGVSLAVMLSVIFTEGIVAVFTYRNALPETALVSTYMFFAGAAMLAQLSQFTFTGRNFVSKIAATVMFLSGLIYGVTMLPFIRSFGAGFGGEASVILAVIFAAATVLLFCLNLYRSGKGGAMRKVYVKNTVLTAAGFAMLLLFANGVADISETFTETIFYIVSVVLAACFFGFIMATRLFGGEPIASAPDGSDSFDGSDGNGEEVSAESVGKSDVKNGGKNQSNNSYENAENPETKPNGKNGEINSGISENGETQTDNPYEKYEKEQADGAEIPAVKSEKQDVGGGEINAENADDSSDE
ncbi:MAG: hypothetical protein LBP79_03375 [Clostridiales bacterium]|jgi:hypothetical protein|nr:hypothetical protein [Clostridiales bacterium]